MGQRLGHQKGAWMLDAAGQGGRDKLGKVWASYGTEGTVVWGFSNMGQLSRFQIYVSEAIHQNFPVESIMSETKSQYSQMESMYVRLNTNTLRLGYA